MQDTLVSARMPAAKKERARGILDSIGATTSDLINSAFDYVIANNQLPATAASAERPSEQDFEQFVAETTFKIDWPEGTDDYKQLIKEMRLTDYESLA